MILLAYEIPQQLQHKEKIVFGLTFTQLGWVSIFGTIALFILTRKGNLFNNIVLASIPAILGVLFTFFDITKYIRNIYYFLKFRKADINQMNSIIGIKRIENDIIYSYKDVAILQVFPINFGIKNNEDKDAIILGFQKFLNSLDFPIQFVITSTSLNIDEYLNQLKSKVNNIELFNDFSKFLKSIILINKMHNRLFYVIIPKSSDLGIQCKICIERLTSLGLKVFRLTDAQILKNLYTFFNDDKIRKSLGQGINFLIAPNSIVDNINYLRIDDKYCRIISAIGYPRIVEMGFLDKIISSNEDFDISIHIEPFSIESMMIILNKELQKQRADLYSEEIKKSINPSLEIKYYDTRKVLEELQKGTEKLFNISFYINCKGKTIEELELLTKKVESELNSIMIIPETTLFRQISAYKSMIPISTDELKVKRNITTSALSAFFPFTSPFLTLEKDGVMLGLNKNKIPYIKDIFGLSNGNGVIISSSGSGKSYFSKVFITRQLLSGCKVLVIDPQSEYVGLVQRCNGELITISRNSDTMINPLDLMGHEFIEKRLSLMDCFKIMFGELTEIQKSILDKAVNETYARKGITVDSYKYKKPPILEDLYKVLIEMDKKASSMEKITYRALINRLYMYTEGVFGFINTQSNIDFKNDFVCFNIGDMPKQVKPVIMFLILDYVYMKMKETKERKLLVIDEAWSLLGHAEEASYIFEIVKTCRKFNLGLLLITQDVADLINSKAGYAVLSNSSYSLLLRQKPAIIDSVVKTFNLSIKEKEYLLTATQGKGIIILDNEHQEIEIIASPKEHEIITTNPDEIIKKKLIKDDRTEINIGLDTKKGLYYGRELNIEQKNYLNNHGYRPGYHVPINKIKQEECWIKTNNIESLGHTFLVQNIKQEIEKYTKEIEIHLVEDADITFKNIKGEKVALEIETGKYYNKKKLIEKFRNVKAKYKNHLYIILTSKEYKARYKKHFTDTTILLRTDIQKLLEKEFKKA